MSGSEVKDGAPVAPRGESSTPGMPVPWYRLNGWIMQAGGGEWLRYQLHLLGFVIATTPWVYTGPLDIDVTEIESPQAVMRRWPW